MLLNVILPFISILGRVSSSSSSSCLTDEDSGAVSADDWRKQPRIGERYQVLILIDFVHTFLESVYHANMKLDTSCIFS